jgi:hypothetical protein
MAEFAESFGAALWASSAHKLLLDYACEINATAREYAEAKRQIAEWLGKKEIET